MSTTRFIAKVTYAPPLPKRVVTAYVKLPYGAVFGLTETLSRAWAIGLIRWYRIDTVKPGEVTPEIRGDLQRWPNRFEKLLKEVAIA